VARVPESRRGLRIILDAEARWPLHSPTPNSAESPSAGPPMRLAAKTDTFSSRRCPEGYRRADLRLRVPSSSDRQRWGTVGSVCPSAEWRPRSGKPAGLCLDPGDAVLGGLVAGPGGAPNRPACFATARRGGGYLPRRAKQQIVSSRSDEIGQLRGVQSHGRPALPATLGLSGPRRSPASFRGARRPEELHGQHPGVPHQRDHHPRSGRRVVTNESGGRAAHRALRRRGEGGTCTGVFSTPRRGGDPHETLATRAGVASTSLGLSRGTGTSSRSS